MDSIDIHLRVLGKEKKSRFSHFHLEKVPLFRTPSQLKEYILKWHPAKVAPATTTDTFEMGYLVEGQGNKKFKIIDETTLKQAFDCERVCLWVDPYIEQDQPRKKQKTGE